jgi:hypothetical protein
MWYVADPRRLDEVRGPDRHEPHDVLEELAPGGLVVHVDLDLHLARSARDPTGSLDLRVVDAHHVV